MFIELAKKIYKLFITFYNFLLDVLYPKQCLKCEKYGNYFCSNCLDEILLNLTLDCYICHKITPNGQFCQHCRSKYYLSTKGILVASNQEDRILQKIIKNLKYKLVKDLSQPLGKILADFLILHWEQISWLNSKKRIYFIPIPLHRRRLAERGFNQSELIVQQMVNYLKLAGYWSDNFYYLDQLLIRKKYFCPQAKIHNAQVRQKNIRGAFGLQNKLKQKNNTKEIISKEIVVLVDDIVTTGATIEEAASVLKLLQLKEIWGLAVARGK